MKKIVFIGNHPESVPLLENLIQKGKVNFWELSLIITRPDGQVGRKKNLTPSALKNLALEKGIPFLTPLKIATSFDRLATLKPDLILVSDYRQRIPTSILKIPALGCLNVHFSKLPQYRGPSPVPSAILAGEKEIGFSFFLMDESFDTGPLLFTSQFPIDPKDTSGSLIQKLYQKTAQTLPLALKKYFAGRTKPVPQQKKNVSYTRYLNRKDGKINWQKNDGEIERMIRAFSPWPGAWTFWKGKRLKIWQAHLDEKGKLVLDHLQLEGKKMLPLADFIKGYPDFSLANLKAQL